MGKANPIPARGYNLILCPNLNSRVRLESRFSVPEVGDGVKPVCVACQDGRDVGVAEMHCRAGVGGLQCNESRYSRRARS